MGDLTSILEKAAQERTSSSTLLEDALQMNNLRLAWEEIADNAGIAGTDQISIKAWRRNWEERLVRLARAVRANTYQPHKLRKRRIPKRDPSQTRLLRIPTVTDRVLQRAVLQVLYPVLEPMFLDCSFGYRPGIGLQDAVERILVVRENGFRWLLDADIDAFFDHVDHILLLQFLKYDLPDQSLMPLIGMWLKAGSCHPEIPLGIPMGSPLSPLFANLFLHRLDKAVTEQGHPVVRYADDFVVFAASQTQAEAIQQGVGDCLELLHLRYEPYKTRITNFDQGFDFLGVRFEGDTYTYEWENVHIEVNGDRADWLFSRFGPDYT